MDSRRLYGVKQFIILRDYHNLLYSIFFLLSSFHKWQCFRYEGIVTCVSIYLFIKTIGGFICLKNIMMHYLI